MTAIRLVFAVLTLAWGANPLSAATAAAMKKDDPAARRVVSVSGHETVRIPASRARLTSAVEVQARTPAAAQDAARRDSKAVLDFLRRSNVERLQAGVIALHPVYGRERPPHEGREGPPQITAYRAQWSATFEVDAERAGVLADGLVESGAARISQFEFIATEDAVAKARQEALQRASIRAREDAHAILAALGYRPSEVVRVDAHPGGPVQPQRRMETMAMSLDRGSGPTPVEPGMVEVEGSVTIEIAY